MPKEIAVKNMTTDFYEVPDEIAELSPQEIMDYIADNQIPVCDNIDSGIWGDLLYVYDDEKGTVREF